MQRTYDIPQILSSDPRTETLQMPYVLGLVPDTEFISLKKVFLVHFWVAFSLKRSARPFKPLD